MITYTPYLRNEESTDSAESSSSQNYYQPRYFDNSNGDDSHPISPYSPGGGFNGSAPQGELPDDAIHGRFSNREDFKRTMTAAYEAELSRRGFNTEFARSLAAQDALESNYGSQLGANFNYGGIKDFRNGRSTMTTEYINGQYEEVAQPFRDFNSISDYVRYKVGLLNNNRYNAFSGDVSDFARRVSDGGYATAPNYEEVLNQIISTFKNGGILRFQEGGQAAYEWLQNGLDRRSDKVRENFNRYSWFPVPTSLAMYLPKYNLNTVNYVEDPSMVPTGASGVYRPREHTVYTIGNDPMTTVHEYTHAMRPGPQERVIDDLKNKHRNNLYRDPSTTSDEYLDSSAEIYARMMELRYFLEKEGINMDREFSVEDIRNLQNRYTRSIDLQMPNGHITVDGNGNRRNGYLSPSFDSRNITSYNLDYNSDYRIEDTLNRYNPYFLMEVLNTVASNNKSLPQLARRGMKIKKYQEGGSTDVRRLVFDWASNKNGELRYAQNHNESYPTFYTLLRDSNRPFIEYDDGTIGTHKLAYVESDGKGYIYPEIQWEQNNGEWVATDYSDDDGTVGGAAARRRGDYLEIPDEEMARYFTENYKSFSNWYPGFEHTPQVSTATNGSSNYNILDFANSEEVYNYILSLPNSNPYIAAGLTAVFAQESSLDHSKVNRSSGARGIGQLLGDRLREYQKWLNGRSDTWQNQISWIGEKINNGTDDWAVNYQNFENAVATRRLTPDEQRLGDAIKDSKYVNYSFENWRNTAFSMTDPGDIAELFTGTFERPGEKESRMDARRGYAWSAYNQFNQ